MQVLEPQDERSVAGAVPQERGDRVEQPEAGLLGLLGGGGRQVGQCFAHGGDELGDVRARSRRGSRAGARGRCSEARGRARGRPAPRARTAARRRPPTRCPRRPRAPRSIASPAQLVGQARLPDAGLAGDHEQRPPPTQRVVQTPPRELRSRDRALRTAHGSFSAPRHAPPALRQLPARARAAGLELVSDARWRTVHEHRSSDCHASGTWSSCATRSCSRISATTPSARSATAMSSQPSSPSAFISLVSELAATRAASSSRRSATR